jgi:hypothetical protein
MEEVKRSRHVSPESFFFSSLLGCYYRSRDRRDWERGAEIFRGIEQQHRNERVYVAGLILLGKLGREEEAMAVYLEAKERCRRWPDPFIEKEARRATGRLWGGGGGRNWMQERESAPGLLIGRKWGSRDMSPKSKMEREWGREEKKRRL